MQTKKFYPYISTIIVAVVILGAIYIFSGKQAIDGKYPNTPAPLDSFAQCLASKKITMYGAVWCSHCQNEKAGFGNSFRFVPYVECPDNIQMCLDKGVKGYPTWIFGDGRIFEGEQGVQKLSELSGCPLNADVASSTTQTSASTSTTETPRQ